MDKLLERIKLIHTDCNQLCINVIGKYLQSAGNIGIFCQNDIEYEYFTELKNQITKISNNPNQKYFELIEPVKISKIGDMPESIYTYLYIRKPDSKAYGKYLGDIDFILPVDAYTEFKYNVAAGKYNSGVEIYDRPSWDTIQITAPDITSVAYISTKDFAEKVRIKFD